MPELSAASEEGRFDLARFVEAQAPCYDTVVAELRAGAKRSHWMWFVFPQVAGLGSSPTSRHFAISGLAEARAYAAHPVLGARLRECVGILLQLQERSAEDIFGWPDCAKLRSCLTLFDRAVPEEPLFARALARYYRGEPDADTIARL